MDVPGFSSLHKVVFDLVEQALFGRPVIHRQRLAELFQELPLLPDMTVMENIYFGQEPLSGVRTIARRRMRTDPETSTAAPSILVPPRSMPMRNGPDIARSSFGAREGVSYENLSSILYTAPE